MKKLKVAELFAGVGGFRIGLENTKKYETVWSNQWELRIKNSTRVINLSKAVWARKSQQQRY